MPATAKKKKSEGIKWISEREFSAMVDSRARSVLKISAKQFIDRWKKGQYRKLDTDTCPGVIELSLLAPLPRRSSGRKNTKRGRR